MRREFLFIGVMNLLTMAIAAPAIASSVWRRPESAWPGPPAHIAVAAGLVRIARAIGLG